MYTWVLLSSKLYQMIWSSKGTLNRPMFNTYKKKEKEKENREKIIVKWIKNIK